METEVLDPQTVADEPQQTVAEEPLTEVESPESVPSTSVQTGKSRVFTAKKQQPSTKKGPGKPPPTKTGIPAAEDARYLPPPPTMFFSDEKDTVPHRVPGFFRYWQRIASDPRYAGRVHGTIYRQWPIINREIQNKKKQIDQTDKPIESVEDVLHRWGTGDYMVYLNDLYGGKNRQLCRCLIKTPRNYVDSPPQIEPEDLVVSDPQNRTYIAWRRSRGLPVPGDDPQAPKEDEVASASLVEKLMDRDREMTDKLISLSQERSHPPLPVDLPDDDLDATGARSVLDVVTAGARTAIEMTQDAARKATEVQQRGADPVDSFTKIAAAVQTLFPKQDNEPLLELVRQAEARAARLEERLGQEQAARLQALEARLTEKALQTQAQANGEQKPRSFVDELKERVEVQRLMKELAGGRDEDDEEEGGSGRRSGKEPWYTQMLPALIPVGMFLFHTGANMLHNAAVAKTGQGKAEPPPQIPAEALPPEVRAQLEATQAGQGQGQTTANGQAQGEPMNPVKMLVAAIQQPILSHLQQGASGHEFAEWLINGYGLITYQQIVAEIPKQPPPKDRIVEAIRTYAPDLFAVMQSLGPDADRFLDEFVHGPSEAEAE